MKVLRVLCVSWLVWIWPRPADCFDPLKPFKAIKEALAPSDIRGQVVDKDAFVKISHIIVLGGPSKFGGAQERLLNDIESRWNASSSYKILGHQATQKKIGALSLAVPSESGWVGAKGPVRELDEMLRYQIRTRAPHVGIFVLWVVDWTGEKYGRPGTLVDNVFEAVQGRENLPPKPDTNYGRKVVAQLFQASTGREIWRARKAQSGQAGKMVQTSMGPRWEAEEAGIETRKQQNEREYQDFADFFATALRAPGYDPDASE